jgi:hypothetical protein
MQQLLREASMFERDDIPATVRRSQRRIKISRTRFAALTALCLAALAGGCAGRRRRTQDSVSASTSVVIGPIPLRVVNRSTSEVVVYAVRGSYRQRLGIASGLSTANLVVPASVTADRGTFVLAANQIGGSSRYVSDPVAPQRDIQLVLALAPRLEASSVSVE